MSFENIPNEMHMYSQWVVWRFEDMQSIKPTKVPYSPLTGKLAKVNDSSTWSTFEQCVQAAEHNNLYDGIGFVLTEADPYAFIDLDDTKGDQTALDRQHKIFSEFNSFAELSPSGKGLHIIVKGALQTGRRRSSIEIYSTGRYMTMTGNLYRDAPIKDCNEMLNVLWSQMGKSGVNLANYYNGSEEEEHTDEEIINFATNASNGEKFTRLYSGDWSGYNPNDKNDHSSEADFALVDIIAFYSKNKTQIARIFRASGLGQRDKAQRPDYMRYMLNKCFDRMLPPVDIDGLRNQLEDALAKKQKEENEINPSLRNETPVQTEIENTKLPEPKNSIYSIPPGLVGEIAQFIYAQAPRPVPEIALAAALGMMAGIVGRSYNVSGTGLNQYVLLIAATGAGKESMARGIGKLFNQVCKTVPVANEFTGPSEIASPQAILKYMSNGPTSFLSIVGEFGLYLQQMASITAPPHLLGLRRFLLNVYNKSGEGDSLKPSIYADKANNTAEIKSPNFSLLGESTPEKFYEGLHEGLILEGLLPRFTMIEYKGERPPLNPTFAQAQPSFELVEKISTLCSHSLMLNKQDKTINVRFTTEAQTMIDKFDKHCDLCINNNEKEISKQLWSRGHMKAMKLAALVAVGNGSIDPIITIDVVSWAIDLIVADIKNLLDRFNAGEIGIDNDETKQIAKVVTTVKDFVISPWSVVAKYAGDGLSNLHTNRIVPYSFIQRKLAAVAVFRKDRVGSSNALKRTLSVLIDRGDIQEVSRAVLSKTYGTTAKAYMISNPQAFDI